MSKNKTFQGVLSQGLDQLIEERVNCVRACPLKFYKKSLFQSLLEVIRAQFEELRNFSMLVEF